MSILFSSLNLITLCPLITDSGHGNTGDRKPRKTDDASCNDES